MRVKLDLHWLTLKIWFKYFWYNDLMMGESMTFEESCWGIRSRIWVELNVELIFGVLLIMINEKFACCWVLIRISDSFCLRASKDLSVGTFEKCQTTLIWIDELMHFWYIFQWINKEKGVLNGMNVNFRTFGARWRSFKET